MNPETEEWSLEVNECQVWHANLAAESQEAHRMHEFLSVAERWQASRFHFEQDRRAYILTHGILRSLLGSCLGIPPGALGFACHPRGKPYLAFPSNPLDLRFSLSHSRDLALVALTRNHEVGVDVESIKHATDWESVADRHFSAAEQAELTRLKASDQPAAFLRGWTCKEAVLKALGEGIGAGLAGVEVKLAPEISPRLLAIHGDRAVDSHWTLVSWPPAAGFVGAVAVQASGIKVRPQCWGADINRRRRR